MNLESRTVPQSLCYHAVPCAFPSLPVVAETDRKLQCKAHKSSEANHTKQICFRFGTDLYTDPFPLLLAQSMSLSRLPLDLASVQRIGPFM